MTVMTLSSSSQNSQETKETVTNFIANLLSTAVGTEHSIHSCSGSIQKRFADTAELMAYSIEAIINFFMTVDNITRKKVFFILNDLVQYDPRFRLPVLSEVLPKIGLTISMINDKDIYLKTVTIWESRKIYPPEVCRSIMRLFQLSCELDQSIYEYDQRLSSLLDMLQIRSVKDKELQNLCDIVVSQDELIERAEQALSASSDKNLEISSLSQLKNLSVMTRAMIVATQGISQYMTRLSIDCGSRPNYSNIESFKQINTILQKIDLANP